MKHLKTYENILPDLKKYIICKSNDGDLLCLEIINDESPKFDNFTKVCTLSFDNNNNVYKSDQLTTTITEIKKRIVFQSDDINDIINNLKLIKATDKYNI